jgi:PAS domain S-box-containing protein
MRRKAKDKRARQETSQGSAAMGRPGSNTSAKSELHSEVTANPSQMEEPRLSQFTVDKAADSIFWIGPEAHFLYANEAACRTLGYTRSQLLSMKVFDIDPDFSSEIWERHWSELKREGSLTFESRHRTRDGRIFPVEVTANFLEFDDREYNCAHARDITDRKLAEEALRESEAKFRILSEQGLLAIIVIQDNVVKYANRAVAELVEYAVPEMLGWGENEFAKIIHPHDRNFVMIQAQKKQAGDKDVITRYSYRLVTKSGNTKWVDQYSKTVVYDGRNADFVSIIDISERKEANEVLQKAHDELEFLVEERTVELTEANRKLKRRIFDLYTIFELSRNFNAVLNYQTLLDSFVLTSLGQMGAAKAALYLPREIGGKRFHLARTKGSPPFPEEEIFIDPDGQFGKYITAYNRPVFISDIADKMVASEELKFLKYFDRGLIVPLIFQAKLRGALIISQKETGQPFQDEDIEFLSILANQTAVSIENARLYESEKEALEKLQQSQRLLLQTERLAALGELSAKVAHEVNNPLGIIKNYLQLLTHQIENNGKAEEYISVVRQEIDRINVIVRQLLNMGKPTRITFVRSDLRQILREVILLMNRQMTKAGVSVALQADKPVPKIMAWPDGLKQVFMNLLINSMDAMRNGGNINIKINPGEHIVRITFEDSGPGIKPEHIPHIFEPFYSTKEADSGTGLGLSVSHAIIKNHNGAINFSNTDNGGCFRIELPIEQEEAEYESRE